MAQDRMTRTSAYLTSLDHVPAAIFFLNWPEIVPQTAPNSRKSSVNVRRRSGTLINGSAHSTEIRSANSTIQKWLRPLQVTSRLPGNFHTAPTRIFVLRDQWRNSAKFMISADDNFDDDVNDKESVRRFRTTTRKKKTLAHVEEGKQFHGPQQWSVVNRKWFGAQNIGTTAIWETTANQIFSERFYQLNQW